MCNLTDSHSVGFGFFATFDVSNE